VGERADGWIPILRPIDPHWCVTEGRPEFGVGGLVPRACAEMRGRGKLSFGPMARPPAAATAVMGHREGGPRHGGWVRLCAASSLGKGMGSKNEGEKKDTTAATEEWVGGWVRRLGECI